MEEMEEMEEVEEEETAGLLVGFLDRTFLNK